MNDLNTKTCRDCGIEFIQFSSFQTRCGDCTNLDNKWKPQNIRREFKKTLRNKGKVGKQWDKDRAKWIRQHPPNDSGFWECYLQLPGCIHYMDRRQLTLDHVESRSRNPEKRRTLSNFRPACYPCNQKKGSRTVAQVRELYGLPAL